MTKYKTLFKGKNLYLYYILFATIHYLSAVVMVYDRCRITRYFIQLYEHAYSIVDIVYSQCTVEYLLSYQQSLDSYYCCQFTCSSRISIGVS